MICVAVPVLDRPHAVAPLVLSFRESLRDAPAALYFLVSQGDLAEIEAVRVARELAPEVGWALVARDPGPGDYAHKINYALHRIVPEIGATWIFTGADDLRFHPGWADAALAVAASSGAGVIGTNDLGNGLVMAGKHSTHSLVRVAYAMEQGLIDRRGAVYHEGYDHQYCDNELVETAQIRGEFAFAADSVVEHLHPIWRKAANDATYERGQSGRLKDKALYQRRRVLWTTPIPWRPR